VAEDLVVEGRAADQTIEAVRVKNAKNFAIGVQWHPEYKSTENAASTRLFEAFGAAVRARSAARQAS
jgi:putative glutamine amidotransferase